MRSFVIGRRMFVWLTLIVVVVLAVPTSAQRICGEEVTLDLSNTPVLPLGGEVIGVSVAEGTVVGATVGVTFTAAGSFDAADLVLTLCLPTNQSSACHAIYGDDQGWSGQGTFFATIETQELNGFLTHADGLEFYSWFATVGTSDITAPITGTIDEWTYTLQMEACPPGDLDNDIDVDVADLLALLSAWGQIPDCDDGPPCGPDINGDRIVDTDDLLALLQNWGSHY